jgi:hypothetical protein
MSVTQEDVRRAVLALRQLGCAVVIFSPEALQGVSREDVERHMYFTASEFIDDRRAKEVVA